MENRGSQLLDLVAEYLRSGKLLHLSTSSNGRLWMCHVWYALGPNDNTLVFTSNKARRHSREIALNPIVAGGVVAIDLDGLGQKIRGLSFEGTALEAVGENISQAYECYATRWPQVRNMFTVREIESGATAMRMYTVSMSRVVLFDEVNFPKDPRQEIVFSGS